MRHHGKPSHEATSELFFKLIQIMSTPQQSKSPFYPITVSCSCRGVQSSGACAKCTPFKKSIHELRHWIIWWCINWMVFTWKIWNEHFQPHQLCFPWHSQKWKGICQWLYQWLRNPFSFGKCSKDCRAATCQQPTDIYICDASLPHVDIWRPRGEGGPGPPGPPPPESAPDVWDYLNLTWVQMDPENSCFT